MKRRIVTTATIVISMVCAALSFAPSAGALTARDVKKRISAIRHSLEKVSAGLESAEERLEFSEAAIEQHRAALWAADLRRAHLRRSINRQAAALYMMGSTGGLDPLSASTDVSTLVDRIVYLDQIRQGERGLIEDLRALESRAETEATLLKLSEIEAQSTRDDLASRQKELLRQLDELTRLWAFISPRTAFRATRGGRGVYCPVVGPNYVSRNFGQKRPGHIHQGVDIRANIGQYVRAVLGAVIVDTKLGTGYGKGIVIRDGAGNEWWYAHLSAISVRPGQRVAAGEIIGKVGCTGRCYGPHLHFEFHPNAGAAADPYPHISTSCARY